VTISVVPNTTPPKVATQVPLAGLDLTNFTSLRVIFTERVQGVDAGDLLISGIPATNVTAADRIICSHSRSHRTAKRRSRSPTGMASRTSAFLRISPFNALSPDAQWEYDLIDRTPPFIVGRSPAAGTTVTNLTQISVAFSETVTNVDAGDLLVNGTPALSVARSGTNYVFSVAQPASGTVTVSWATNHGITDIVIEPPPNPLNGTASGWTFTLDARTILLQTNSTWKYLKGLAEASSPTDAWRQFAFDDSSWSTGPAPFVFGETTFTNATMPGTDLGDMANNGYSSIYLRKMFFVPNLGAVTNLLMAHQSDDGFIAWLNGTEVFRYNMATGAIAFNGSASAQAPEANNAGVSYIPVLLTNAVFALVPGTNILTVHAFNVISTPASSDFVFNAQLYTYLADVTATAPRIAQADPAQGDVLSLTNLTITFSEGVSGVDAADLLVNGVPAASVSSTTNTTYTFRFAQPPFGAVVVTWATNHGIADMDMVPKPFDATAGSATLRYTLINPSNPRIASQVPAASTTVTGLTSIAVTFTEPVSGVNAADLLVSGIPASAVTGSGSNYVFTFPQPAFGSVPIRWATSHGITDLETPPNSFDPTRFGGQWNYTLIDPRPTVTLISPTNGTFVLPTNVVTLRATASDRDGTITRVEFLSGGTLLGQGNLATNAQYTLVWSKHSVGQLHAARRRHGQQRAFLDLRARRAQRRYKPTDATHAWAVFAEWLDHRRGGSLAHGFVLRRPRSLWNRPWFAHECRSASCPDERTHRHAHWPERGHEILLRDCEFKSVARRRDQHGRFELLVQNFAAGRDATVRFASGRWAIPAPPTTISARVRDAYYTYARTNGPADFWLMLGDNAYNSGLQTEYQSRGLRHVSRDVAQSFPLAGDWQSRVRAVVHRDELRVSRHFHDATKRRSGRRAHDESEVLLVRLREHPLRRSRLDDQRARYERRDGAVAEERSRTSDSGMDDCLLPSSALHARQSQLGQRDGTHRDSPEHPADPRSQWRRSRAVRSQSRVGALVPARSSVRALNHDQCHEQSRWRRRTRRWHWPLSQERRGSRRRLYRRGQQRPDHRRPAQPPGTLPFAQ
jgi:hypothetical protein